MEIKKDTKISKVLNKWFKKTGLTEEYLVDLLKEIGHDIPVSFSCFSRNSHGAFSFICKYQYRSCKVTLNSDRFSPRCIVITDESWT